jgi:hypothetical protein
MGVVHMGRVGSAGVWRRGPVCRRRDRPTASAAAAACLKRTWNSVADIERKRRVCGGLGTAHGAGESPKSAWTSSPRSSTRSRRTTARRIAPSKLHTPNDRESKFPNGLKPPGSEFESPSFGPQRSQGWTNCDKCHQASSADARLHVGIILRSGDPLSLASFRVPRASSRVVRTGPRRRCRVVQSVHGRRRTRSTVPIPFRSAKNASCRIPSTTLATPGSSRMSRVTTTSSPELCSCVRAARFTVLPK